MLQVRRSKDRGHARHGWLESFHTFSFADYRDPAHMGFRALRVINEDFIEPGKGFGTHSHEDMEILSYVIEGALEHADSMGNGSIIRPGEVQYMRAGTGVTHSEKNPSTTENSHLLQIWVLPGERGLAPAYDQKEFPERERRDALRLVASPDGADGSIRIRQDVSLYATILDDANTLEHRLARGRHAWIQVVRGEVEVEGIPLEGGDGIAVSDEPQVKLCAQSETELLLFDLA